MSLTKDEWKCGCMADYHLSSWIPHLMSVPIREIEHYDHSEDYSVYRGHVFELENRKFALITERGCSCYSGEDAEINIFESENEALSALARFKQ